MKFTEKQTEAWMALGEAAIDIYMRVTDLSLPDDVALDRAWALRRIRELKKLSDRWFKTLPGIVRNSANSRRRKARARALMEMLPTIMVEASGPGSTASVTYEGETISAEAVGTVSNEEPN